MAHGVTVVVVGRLGEGADLADHALGPVPDESLTAAALRNPHPASPDDVRHDGQPLDLVSPARVVGPDEDVGTLQVLYQGDARGLLLHQHEIHSPGVLALTVDHLVLVQHLVLHVRVL